MRHYFCGWYFKCQSRGYSFPKRYLWTQCFFPNGSLMLSVAEIPFGFLHFTGIISVIHVYGKEYRLATYLGATVTKLDDGEVKIRQGKLTRTVPHLNMNIHKQQSHFIERPVAVIDRFDDGQSKRVETFFLFTT